MLCNSVLLKLQIGTCGNFNLRKKYNFSGTLLPTFLDLQARRVNISYDFTSQVYDKLTFLLTHAFRMKK